MGITYARGRIIGKLETREYDFLVDTGSTWLTLPPANIAELGLDILPSAVAEISTPTGIIHVPMYQANGALEDVPLDAYAVPAPRLLVGYELLQKLGFVVDLVRERIVLRSEWPGDLS